MKDIGIVSKILTEASIEAGEILGVRCRIDSESKVGENWYMVH